MTRLSLTLALAMLPLTLAPGEPVQAEIVTPDATEREEDSEDGLGLMGRGARMLMEGLMQEMEPALDDLEGMADTIGPALRSFASEMGPAFSRLMGEIKDFSDYEAPVILPNGDIVIRRKPEADPYTPSPRVEPNPDGTIDL
ncbi:hypothetical protein [Pseudooceanicola aestuarii]|uniref:hypothetical protein n=1 Tax=Pseudooceanicola aestuarii TaxID=2697319 RepID=UPI0013D1E814|nr:hypothetical protein [Pseudooceanicola aestuarii]